MHTNIHIHIQSSPPSSRYSAPAPSRTHTCIPTYIYTYSPPPLLADTVHQLPLGHMVGAPQLWKPRQSSSRDPWLASIPSSRLLALAAGGMYACMYVCMYVCMCVSVNICVSMCVCLTCVQTHTDRYIYLRRFLSSHLLALAAGGMYVCMFKHIYGCEW